MPNSAPRRRRVAQPRPNASLSYVYSVHRVELHARWSAVGSELRAKKTGSDSTRISARVRVSGLAHAMRQGRKLSGVGRFMTLARSWRHVTDSWPAWPDAETQECDVTFWITATACESSRTPDFCSFAVQKFVPSSFLEPKVKCLKCQNGDFLHWKQSTGLPNKVLD